MESREEQDAASGMEEFRRRYTRVRSVGRAGQQRPGSRRRSALYHGVLHCTSVLPASRRAAARKPAVHRLRPESAVQKDASDFDSLAMHLSSDHTKLNHRRSSLPMDYRMLAGMTPKWYANVKEERSILKQKRRSVSNQEEATNVEKHLEAAVQDNGLSASSSNDVSTSLPCEVVLVREPDICYKTEVPPTFTIKQCSDTASSQSHLYFVEKLMCSESETILGPCNQFDEKCNVDNSNVSHFPPASSVPVSLTHCGEAAVAVNEDTLINTEQEHVDTQTASSAGHCHVDRPTVGTVMLSDSSDTMYKNAACCSSGCDCFSFCGSSIEDVSGVLPKNKVDMDGSVTSAAYIGCDGSSCQLMCDLHLVGALETVPESADMESANGEVDGHSEESAAAISEHEDFVDNVCVDCGCELMPDDMTECAFSVPVCSMCSQDVDHNVPSVDDVVAADHGYVCLSTDSLLCPSPQKLTSSLASAICQQPQIPDVDVVDDITFLSFQSKYLMHKYVSRQQNSCEPAAKSSWVELARCERSWHRSHRSAKWFGSARHRHIDRFSAHNRLNEQIELGLVMPLSAHSSAADLHGIRLKTCLSQNNSDRTVVGGKLKCRSRHLPSDSIQRPTRVAARGQHYRLTRYRRKGLRTLANAQCVVVMKLSQQQASDALELLHAPSVITRDNCGKPGCCFGCICSLFERNRFPSAIGAQFNGTVTVPEFPVIDDSWRQNVQSSSADTSFASSADDSLDQLNNSSLSLDDSIASPVLSVSANSANPSFTATADSRNLLEQCKRYRSKRRKRSRCVGIVSDSLSPTPPATDSLLHKRRRLKRRWSQVLASAGADADDLKCSAYPKQDQQQVKNPSLSLPYNNDGCIDLGEFRARKRRRRRSKSQVLPADSDDHTESVVPKKHRRSSSGKRSTPGTRKKTTDDATTTVSTPSQEQVVEASRGSEVMVGEPQQACSVVGSISRTNTAAVTSTALHRANVRLQNIATGKCYVLQPVVKGAGHSSKTSANKKGIAAYSVQPVSGAVSRFIGVVGHRQSAAVTVHRSTSSAIPRLVPLSVSAVVSSTTSTTTTGSGSAAVAAAPCLANLLQQQSLLSAASVSAPSSSSASRIISSRGAALTFSPSILSKNSSPSSGQHLSTPSSSSSGNGAMSPSTALHTAKPDSQPYQTQMILFQQKPDGAMSSRTRLLEIASNCDWGRVRPKVLAWLSDLTKNADGYPQTCHLSVGGFRVEVLPRPQRATDIPERLRESLGMTAMFAIRVRITPEARLLPAAVSRSLAAVASAALKLQDRNGLNPASTRFLLVDSPKQKTTVANADATQQTTQNGPASSRSRHSTQEITTTTDSSQQVAASTDISQQKTNLQSCVVDVSQHVPTALSESSDSSSTADTGVSKSVCPSVGSDGVLQTWPEHSLGVSPARTAVDDTMDHCSGCYSEGVTGFDSDSRICTGIHTHTDNSDSCQQDDATVINNDGISIGAGCIKVENSSDYADAGNFPSSVDSENFPSSLSQSLPPNSTEVACSQQSHDENFPSSDDGNFLSSSGVSVPIAYPLDLRT